MEAGGRGGGGAAVLLAGRLHHGSRLSHSFFVSRLWSSILEVWKPPMEKLYGLLARPSFSSKPLLLLLPHFRWRRRRIEEWAGSLLLGAPEARGDGAQRQSLLLLLGRELRQTLLLLLDTGDM